MKILTIVKMKLQSKIKVSKNLKFLAIHIFLCLLSKSFAYQHRKYFIRIVRHKFEEIRSMFRFFTCF